MAKQKSEPQVVKGDAIDLAMRDMALCPFCGSSQGLTPELRFVRFEVRIAGEKWFYVSCWLCGGQGPTESTPIDAIKRWNKRGASKAWTPLGPHSYILPGVQKYSTVIIHEGGQHITLIDYIESEIMPDGIAAQLDINLGNYRLAALRGVEFSGEQREVQGENRSSEGRAAATA